MKNNWIGFLIVLSIALQSFVAVANSNDNHQVDSQHLQTEHSHDADKFTLLDEPSDDDHNINDCHHCGHCQGFHSSWFVMTSSNNSILKSLMLDQYFYHAHLDKSVIKELIRPPIA